MALTYSNAGERKTARATAAEISGERFRSRLYDNGPLIAIVLLAFLIIAGLSVAMREWRFAGDKSKNPMGAINGVLTLSAVGFYLGFVLTAKYESSGDAWANMFDPLFAFVFGLAGGFVGIIVGTIIGILPPVRRAFTNNPVLYYLPTAISAIVALVVISKIFS
jgi:hypothetical protein